MKNGNIVVLVQDDLITKSLNKNFKDVSIHDLYRKPAMIAVEKADIAIYSDGTNFSIIKDRWGIGYLGQGSAGKEFS